MTSIAVVGGGYAGVRAAQRLDELLDSRWSITLVDRGSDHQLITRLPEILGGRIKPARACVPFRRILSKRIRLLRVEVLSIDPTRHRVETSGGPLIADWLVVALGSAPDFLGLPIVRDQTLVMRSVEDALRLRRRVEQLLREGSVLRAVIVGAGYTGTEVAGELAEWNLRLRRAGARQRLEVTVVAQDPGLLPEGNARLAAIAERVLRSKGVTFDLGASVFGLEPGRLLLEGSALPADLILWAARSRASPALGDSGWRCGPDGRVRVDPYLRAEGLDRVYVAGDTAFAYDYRRDRLAPASAQLALAEADLVARNLAAESAKRSLREFRPRQIGEALSLGGKDGAAEVTGVVVSGRSALAVKEAALVRYLASLGGVQLAASYV